MSDTFSEVSAHRAFQVFGDHALPCKVDGMSYKMIPSGMLIFLGMGSTTGSLGGMERETAR
jgi:hypothetical protein